jgi:DNA-directed RNA polymerase specialized sigma24 family protein
MRVDLDKVDIAAPIPDDEVLQIHAALTRLEQEDPQQAKIVELKFFGGLTNKEVAACIGIGERSVYRQWFCAKARLLQLVRKSE